MSVSVVMPVFNGEAYLEAAIESVLGQSLKSFEFVIVDDGSTDRSNQIIRKYMMSHGKITLVEQENRGISAARNRGLECARHDLIAVMDADDLMMPTRLERQLAFLRQNPDVTVVCSYVHLINVSGRIVGASLPAFPPLEQIVVEPRKFINFTNSSAMMRKPDVISIGGYREAFSTVEDQDLWARLLARGFKFCVIPEFLLLHRIHSSSISMRNLARQYVLNELIYGNLTRAIRGQEELSPEEFAAIRAARSPFQKVRDHSEFLWISQYKKSSRAFAERRWHEFLPRVCAAVALRPVRTIRRVLAKRAYADF